MLDKIHAVCMSVPKLLMMTMLVMVTAPAYAVLEIPALDVFGAQKQIDTQTAIKLKPSECPPIPQNGATLQVMEVVHIALCNNPSTRTTWFQLRAQATSLNQTKVTELLPDVSASSSLSHSSSRSDGSTDTSTSTSTSASLSYTLFDFGVREATIEAAEQSLQSAMSSYDSALQGLIASTLNNYYNLLSAGYSLEAANDALTFAKQSLDAAKARFKLGVVAKSDVLQAQSSYSQSVLSYEQALNAQQQAHNTLMTGMGADPATHVEIADIDDSMLIKDDFDMRVQDLISIANQERKDLQSQQQSLASSIASLEATKRGNLPSVSMSASQTISNIGINDRATQASGSLGFSVSIPIFTGFSRPYSIKSSELGIKSQKLGIEQTKLSIAQDVWSAYNNYKTAEQSWMTSFDALASSSEFRNIALGRYKAGVGSLLDVQSAQSSYSSAQSSYISARFALLTSRVDLIRSVGILNLDNAMPATPVMELQ